MYFFIINTKDTKEQQQTDSYTNTLWRDYSKKVRGTLSGAPVYPTNIKKPLVVAAANESHLQG